MENSFLSIHTKVEDILFKEKGSKFIGFAYPVGDELEIKKILEHLHQVHPDATHICYAYKLGSDDNNYRANDDGEPSGTAGLPIYNQILSFNLTNILLVSIRYYGGTKLGVSGLIKAYKYSAQITLEAAEIVEKHLEQTFQIKFTYENQGIVTRNIDKFRGELISKSFGDSCVFVVKVRKDKSDEFKNSLESMHLVNIELL